HLPCLPPLGPLPVRCPRRSLCAGKRNSPEDDDENPVAVRWTAEDRGSAGRGQNVRVHLRVIPPKQAHAHPHVLALKFVGCHLEPPLARNRKPLRRPERPFDAMSLERRVVAVAEDAL